MQSGFIFVYGTLMSEFNNPMAQLLRKTSVFIGKGYFNGLIFDLGNFPGAIYVAKEKNKVHGEIYQTDTISNVLKTLDKYEGIDDPYFDLYERKLLPITTNTKVINAETYTLKRTYTSSIKIENGDYLQYLKTKS